MIHLAEHAPAGPGLATLASLPLTAAQKYYYPLLTDNECAPAFLSMFMISEGVRIQPGVSARRLQRALKRLVARHDVLRLRFVEQGGQVRAHLAPEASVELNVRDYGQTSYEDMLRICSDLVAEPMDVTAPLQSAFHLLRFAELGDVILIRLNHIITDAYGATILAEDLIKLFLGLPLGGSGLSHIDYLNEFEAKLPPYEGQVRAYWEELLANPPQPWLPTTGHSCSASAIPLHQVRETSQYSLNLAADDTTRLVERCKANEATVYTAAVAALAEVLEERSGLNDIIGRNVLARSQGTLSNYVGFCVQFPFFRMRVEDGDTILERAAAFRKQLQNTLQYPSIATASPGGVIEESLVAARGVGAELFAHLAAADGRSKSSPFRALFRTAGGAPIQLGPATIERMPFVRTPAVDLSADIHLLIVPFEETTTFKMCCDPARRSSAELEEISTEMAEKLRRV